MHASRLVWIGIVVIGLWAAAGYAQPRQGMGAIGPGRMLEDGPGMLLPLVLKGIDLSEAQEKRVQEIMATHRATFRTLFSELQATHKDLADKLFAPGNLKAEDFTMPMQRMAQLREQLAQEGLQVAIEVRDVLTPEQITKAAEIKDRVRALHTEMRGLFRGKH
jgi:Spy/CpxP family protein refolding chaperone